SPTKTTVSLLSSGGSRSNTVTSESRSPWMSPTANVRATGSILLRPRRGSLPRVFGFQLAHHIERLLHVGLDPELRHENVGNHALSVDDERGPPRQEPQRRFHAVQAS